MYINYAVDAKLEMRTEAGLPTKQLQFMCQVAVRMVKGLKGSH
jgi:hypothetical protein